jgi:site-specific recombinase XerD
MVLRNFIWYCHQNDFPEIHKLNSFHIRHFLWYLGSETNRWNSTNPGAMKKVSQATLHDYFKTLRTFFSWLEREELIIENPFKRLKPPKVDKKIIQALTPAEIERLMKAYSGKSYLDVRNKAILSIFIDTGLRVSELTNLTLEDVNIDDGSILVQHGKGGKQRVVRIGNKAQKALWKYITIYRKSDSSRLFTSQYGEPLEVRGIKILFKRVGDKLNIKVYPHKLRHTFAISFLRAGGDVFSLQYLLGHSTLQMTQRYLQSLNANDAMNAHKKFSPLDNMGK